MNILDRARADLARISGNSDEFGAPAVITAPGGETANIVCLHTKHHVNSDPDVKRVNTKISSIAVSEVYLTDQLYPVRDSQGEVSLYDHRVDIPDSTGLVKQYQVKEWYPDEMLGLIVCFLGDYE